MPLAAPTQKVIYRQTPFGEEPQEKYISPWRFSAKRVDPETGLTYYGRRYYAPALGRWLTPDPAGFTDSLNLYAFVKNNPLLYTDLYGLYTSDNAASVHYDPGPAGQVSGATLLERALESSRDVASAVWTSPYFYGTMQLIGGASEVVIGSVLTIECPLGILLLIHGSDQSVAGLRTIYNGASVPTATNQLLQLTGLDPGTAELIDNGMGIVGVGLAGRALLNTPSFVNRWCTFQLPAETKGS